MTTATLKGNPAWQAEVMWKRRFYTTKEKLPPHETGEGTEGLTLEVPHVVRDYFVHVFKPAGEGICFLVNHREGRCLSFTDPRERSAGTEGTTGIWGTRPGLRAAKPRSLTPSAFRREVARLIGAERADEIVQALMSPEFFCGCL